MAKSNKFEQDQLKQINEAGGLFSAFWRLLLTNRIRSAIKKFENDPKFRDTNKRLEKAIEDVHKAYEISMKIDAAIPTKGRTKAEKERIKLYKEFGML